MKESVKIEILGPKSPSKVRAFARPIRNRPLMAAICRAAGLTVSSKLPRDFQSTFSMALYSDRYRSYDQQEGKHTWWPFEGYHLVVVKSAVRQGVPRVFVKCACGQEIPFGRVYQHTHDPKFGTVEVASE